MNSENPERSNLLRWWVIRGSALFVSSAICVTAVWNFAYQAALDELGFEAEQKLSQAVDQFQSQLSTARILPTLLARNSSVVASLDPEQSTDKVLDHLIRARELSGAYNIRIVNGQGVPTFSTNREASGQSDGTPKYLQRALHGALGVAVSFDKASGKRTLTFARSIIDRENHKAGAVVLDVDLEPLETVFRPRREVLMFLDESNTVLFSNRSPLIFKTLVFPDTKPGRSSKSHTYPADLGSKLIVKESARGQVVLWNKFSEAPSPSPAIFVEQDMLTLGLKAVLLADSKPALDQAYRITYLFAAIVALILATAVAIQQRRRRLVERLATEQKLTVELDRRVEDRSRELEKAQNELVQAAKLSALGKMSAGISHELNQPVASIQNFAVLAKRLVTDNRLTEALENLTDIEGQTERMSRIIKNLRDFARKDDLPTNAVDICEIVEQAIKLSSPHLEEENVKLSFDRAETSLFVFAGKVRLQQVLINLIENATHALKNQTDKKIEINVNRSDESVEVHVRDNGPGLSEPNRVFEPFYTTKSGPNDDGLGLGLSISYGFVEGFGGSLRATNQESGGALFTLTLPTATTDEGAL